MVNLEWFRTFKTIYETGSLTSAANKLYISQPGVSLHLNSLEAHVGYKLFDRGTRKMLPTEHGSMLYNSIVEAVRKMEEAEAHFFRNTNADRASVSIGLCFETFQYVLEPHVSELPFNLISKFGCYHEMLNDLDKGLLDFVISPQKNDDLSLHYTPFATEKIIVVAGSQNELTEFNELLALNDVQRMEHWLNQQLWFGTNGDMEHLRNFWLHNFKKRPNFKPCHIVPNLTSIIRCIANQKGFAVIPDFLAQKHLGKHTVQLVWEGFTPLENQLHFVQRKKTIYEQELDMLKHIFIEQMSISTSNQ